MIDFDFCDESFADVSPYEDTSDICAQHADAYEDDSYEELKTDSPVSFKGHIDDIYNPEINRAYDDLDKHTEEFLHSRTAEDTQSSLEHIKEDRRSIDYWEDCKREAMIESKKNDIFLDGINAQLEIIEKYRK